MTVPRKHNPEDIGKRMKNPVAKQAPGAWTARLLFGLMVIGGALLMAWGTRQTMDTLSTALWSAEDEEVQGFVPMALAVGEQAPMKGEGGSAEAQPTLPALTPLAESLPLLEEHLGALPTIAAPDSPSLRETTSPPPTPNEGSPDLSPAATSAAPLNGGGEGATSTPQSAETAESVQSGSKEGDFFNPPGILSEKPFVPEVPRWLVIEKIDLYAPIEPAQVRYIRVENQIFEQWRAPENGAVGWHSTSARLGEAGNTVLNGHHNTKGEVFRRLEEVEVGDIILVIGERTIFRYVVVNRLILPELNQKPEKRLENARWIAPSDDERLTIVSCYPIYSNTHRLILVARPVDRLPIPSR